MVRLLGKLLENAVQNTPAGGRVELSFERKPTGMSTFTVTDTGPGISPGAIDTLLIPFAAQREIDERRVHGTGLSLPICKIIAELHGGALEIANLTDGGLSVSVHLPPSRAADSVPDEVSARRDEETGADHYPAGAPIQDLHRTG